MISASAWSTESRAEASNCCRADLAISLYKALEHKKFHWSGTGLWRGKQ